VSPAQVEQLVQDIAEDIYKLNNLPDVHLSDDQVFERARNIATALLGNYRMEPLP
jgi:hypothetical protein